jgi:hypothetical protein
MAGPGGFGAAPGQKCYQCGRFGESNLGQVIVLDRVHPCTATYSQATLPEHATEAVSEEVSEVEHEVEWPNDE